MSYTFRPAVRQETSILWGLAGPSSSGKTLSALRMARGLLNGDDSRIFMIDTEQGRALHYAPAPGEARGPYKFQFNHLPLAAPFSPTNYAGAIEAAIKASAGAIIVDSMSHEHEGQGGILEMHEAMLKKMAGEDWAKRERMKFTAWIEPKSQHNRLVNMILQQRCHMIFCFRAKDKLMLVKNEQTKKIEPVPVGWTAICSDRFEYEMTGLLMLPPNGQGVPELKAPQTKLQEQHRGFFPAGKPIDENCGKGLAAWAKGGAPAAKSNGAAKETPAVEPSHVAPTSEEDFMPQDHGELGPREPELGALQQGANSEGDGADELDEVEANHMLQRIRDLPTAADVNKYVTKFKGKITAMPKNLSDMIWDAATKRMEGKPA